MSESFGAWTPGLLCASSNGFSSSVGSHFMRDFLRPFEDQLADGDAAAAAPAQGGADEEASREGVTEGEDEAYNGFKLCTRDPVAFGGMVDPQTAALQVRTPHCTSLLPNLRILFTNHRALAFQDVHLRPVVCVAAPCRHIAHAIARGLQGPCEM